MLDESVLEHRLNGDEDPKDLPLALLEQITDQFSEERKIGQGGFGAVYKGELQSGSIVAVKRIDVNIHTIDDKLFRREFNSLRKINHQNVVRFLGFCSSSYQTPIQEAGSEEINMANVRERLLCFEYINNGTLHNHITDELRGLEWEMRYDIITGICNGLFHLKEQNIIHMDLKPTNILVDYHMIPKITDFGLSRPNENSHTMGLRFGTRGYSAPEYVNDGKTSFECDIYSLGVIITELVTGRKDIPDNSDNVLRRWRHRWNIPPTFLQYQQVTRCIEIAVCCRQKEPKARSPIETIISILGESRSTDGHTGQEMTYLDDDMLGIEPLELQFTFKLNKEMSCLVELTNKTKACFAFTIENPSKEYTVVPNKRVMPPGCNECHVQITIQSQERGSQVTENGDKFTVRSTKVSEGLRDQDITEHIFREEAGKVVDEVDLMVVYEKGSHKRGPHPSVLVEAASPKRRAISCSNYEDGTRGQCTKQLDRHNCHPPEHFSHSQPTNMTYLVRVSDRALDVTRGAIGSLLHKLGVLHKDEFNLETSVKEDIDSLSKELVKMQPLLQKLSEGQQNNLSDMVRCWASNVREMSYDLEDFVDGFLVRSEPDSNTSGFRELTHELCFHLDKGNFHHTIRDLVKDKSKQVQYAAKEYKEYKIDNVVPNVAPKAAIDDLRSLVIHRHTKGLVGIETPRDEIIRIFEEDGDVSKQNPKIVSIVGLGGLGKTTLAKAVYDKLKAQFNPKTFVSVGQNPDVKKVLENIIRKIDKREFSATNLDDLIEKLQELLENKRYFIVIDDIWDSKAWDLIQLAFPETDRGSRVITTTRIHDVALATCNSDRKYVYRMKPLNDQDSRELFLRRTFGPDINFLDTTIKEEISKYILKTCGGMPLAINSIASYLAGKEDDTTWENLWKSLGALTEGNTDFDNMKQILDLSYIHLPDDLKTCLLYACKYPEDREIDKNVLARQWVAEGFVSAEGRLNAFEKAEKNFNELINMCMIEPGKIDYNNEVLSCRVHDLILDLITSKSTEVNFLHVIDGLKDVSGQFRRVSIHYNDKEDSRIRETIKWSLSHARSVSLYRGSLVPLVLGFKYVRVLHLEHGAYSTDTVDLTGISRLFLLRYLKIAFSGCKLELPDQIGQLQRLETIDIKGCTLEKYPSDIASLPLLSHLGYDFSGMALPDEIGALKSLCTLEGVCVHKSSVDSLKGLGQLTNLKKLHICSDSVYMALDERALIPMRENAFYSSISRLATSLRVLTFGDRGSFLLDVTRWSTPLFPGGSRIRELDMSYCIFPSCPVWIGQLHHLHRLNISVRQVADGVSIVGGLRSLVYFHLFNCTLYEKEKEESVVIRKGAFQALKQLLFGCKKASLTFELGAMPKLERLYLLFRHYRPHQFLPVGIQHLTAPTLQAINLTVADGITWTDWANYDLSQCLLKSAEDLHTEEIQYKTHVSSLLKGAFKAHHPGADIVVRFNTGGFYMQYDNNEESERSDGVDHEDHEEGGCRFGYLMLSARALW